MRLVAIAIIAGVAALIGWMALRPECAGGVIAETEAQCARVGGFDRAFCARAFARPQEAIARAGVVFATHAECSQRHPVCVEYPGVHGYTPQPAGFCLVRAENGALAQMTPVYGPRKQDNR